MKHKNMHILQSEAKERKRWAISEIIKRAREDVQNKIYWLNHLKALRYNAVNFMENPVDALKCDECDEQKSDVVSFEDKYGDSRIQLCKACIQKSLTMLT